MLTGHVLKEALSKLTDEELSRPLILDVHSFMSLKNLQRDDLLGNLELANSTLLIIPSIRDISPPEDRTVVVSVYPKGEKSPPFLVARADKETMTAFREFHAALPLDGMASPPAKVKKAEKAVKPKKEKKGKKAKKS